MAPIFEHFNVDMVFSGHSHSYQRSKLRKDFITSSKGVYYIVSGGAGKGANVIGLVDEDCQTPPLRQAAVKDDYHFVQISIDGSTLALEAVDMNGEIFDTFTYTKETPQPESED